MYRGVENLVGKKIKNKKLKKKKKRGKGAYFVCVHVVFLFLTRTILGSLVVSCVSGRGRHTADDRPLAPG